MRPGCNILGKRSKHERKTIFIFRNSGWHHFFCLGLHCMDVTSSVSILVCVVFNGGRLLILLDLSQIMWAGIHAQTSARVKPDEDLIRHIILNSIRSTRVKYAKEYGEVVICADGRNYWRKKVNPYYKSNRKKARDKSTMDFAAIFGALDQIKKDLREEFPYSYIEVDGAEADDVIGALCRLYASRDNPCLVYSADHDFYQLRRYEGVYQISPTTKREVKYDLTPKEYLMEHRIKGDSSDGVTNVFSDPDTLATEGKRQKAVSSAKLAKWVNMSPEEFCADAGVTMERYLLNDIQVDLAKTPQELVDQIAEQYEMKKKTPLGGWGNRILRYFMKHQMRVMTNSLPDFTFPAKEPVYNKPGALDEFF